MNFSPHTRHGEEDSEIRHTPVPANFRYPEVVPEHRKYGALIFTGPPLREDGDWRDYLPPEEDQNKRGVESSACYIEAQQHAIATIEEETFGEADNNYSARFNALLSNGAEDGGDPLKGGDSIRHDGLVRESSMPFENIQSWDEFHSWKGADEETVRAEGKRDLEGKSRNFGIIFERDTPLETKYLKLRNTLKYSPCPVSVAAWYEKNGLYFKPEGVRDNHLVEAVHVDEMNRVTIRDTYAPYNKTLEPNYAFDFGMGWVVKKKERVVKKSFPAKVARILRWWWREFLL